MKNQPPEDTIVELLIEKFRNGQTGSLAYEWHGNNFRFVSTDSERLKHIKQNAVQSADGGSQQENKQEGGEQA